jgi:hypothetical protein
MDGITWSTTAYVSAALDDVKGVDTFEGMPGSIALLRSLVDQKRIPRVGYSGSREENRELR